MHSQKNSKTYIAVLAATIEADPDMNHHSQKNQYGDTMNTFTYQLMTAHQQNHEIQSMKNMMYHIFRKFSVIMHDVKNTRRNHVKNH